VPAEAPVAVPAVPELVVEQRQLVPVPDAESHMASDGSSDTKSRRPRLEDVLTTAAEGPPR
jgi:hypothetical protein